MERSVVGSRDRFLAPLRNVLCERCGLVFLDPMPTSEEIDRYYRELYRAHYHGDSRPRAKALLRDQNGAQQRVELLAGFLRKGDRVLDIGAGTGAFVAAATAAAWTAEGIEPNQDFAQFGREHFSARIHACTLEAAPLREGEFDLITTSHVFEHLRNPLTAFRRVHGLLREDGVFHIGVPDIADPLRTPSARFHFGHTHGFTRESLSMMALKAGFEPIAGICEEGPVLMLRRLPRPITDWLRYPAHAEQMRKFFDEHTMWRHLMSGVPYERFFRRMQRFRRERQELAK